MAKRVAIQGYEGSFHQLAAQRFFGKGVEVVPCAGFRDVIAFASEASAGQAGVMAIENSIAGSILPNYTLLQKSKLHITGEVYLPIRQHLLVNNGVTLPDIREVHSHPMAIQQCIDYLGRHPWKLVETDDTALSARRVQQRRSRHIAAVAGDLAARLFGLHILVRDIHTQKNNYTRFLILQPDAVVPAGANKASVNFETDHSRGSLAKVLVKIAARNINLSKLQSFPIAGTRFSYSFHADMEFDDTGSLHELLQELRGITSRLRVYGIYRNGNKTFIKKGKK